MISWTLSKSLLFYISLVTFLKLVSTLCSSLSSDISWALSHSMGVFILSLISWTHLAFSSSSQRSLGSFQVHWRFSSRFSVTEIHFGLMFKIQFNDLLDSFGFNEGFHSSFVWSLEFVLAFSSLLKFIFDNDFGDYFCFVSMFIFNAFIHILFCGWILGFEMEANVFSHVLQW